MTTETRPAPPWRIALAQYTQHLRSKRRGEGTIYLRSYHLRVLSQSFRTRSPFSVTAEDIERFLANLGAHHSRNTQRSYLTSFRDFYRWALQHGMIQSNPCEYIDPISAEKGIPRPAPWDIYRQAVDTAEPRVRLMMQIAVSSGLRAFEIAAIHSDHLHYDPREGWLLSVPRGKGEKPRDVPVLPIVADKIREAHGYVFPSTKYGSNGLAPIKGKRVTELVSAALPPGVTCHKLRHTFATTHYAAEGNLLALQKALGHASVATTEIYTEVPMSAIRRGVDAIGAMM